MEHSEHHIPRPVRSQLLALGIPATKHTRDDLATLFPEEFNIKATALSTEDVARVLVDLVGRKIIATPDMALPPAARKVEPGWHFCQFYRDGEQLLGMIAPYIAEGLRNGEACLWVLPDAVPRAAACAALVALVGDIDPYFTTGQLELLPYAPWYRDAAGKLKSFEEIAGALLARQDTALAKGFKFLRAAGDAGWVSGAEECKAFVEYEMKVNAALGATKVAAACTYCADVTADEVIAIVAAHQAAFYKPGTPTAA